MIDSKTGEAVHEQRGQDGRHGDANGSLDGKVSMLFPQRV